MSQKTSVCYHCIKETGGCCDSVRIPLFTKEYKLFKKHFEMNGTPEGHTLTLHDDDNDIYEYYSADDPCVFLSKDYACTIYDKRPLICRMYPILWEENEESEELEYHVDFACPLSHRIPIRNFYEWIKQYEKSIEEMGELDFDSDDPHYVNITVLLDEVNIIELAMRKDIEP